MYNHSRKIDVVGTNIKEPVPIPANPSPDIARPTITALDVGARAVIRLPTSKIKTALMNTHLMEHSW
jgi:hypothetical protein